MSDVYDDRQLAKKRNQLYREVAAKKHGVKTNLYGNVQPMSDGAFVEIIVWVPLTDIEIRCPRHGCPVHLDEACQKCIDENPIESGRFCICTMSCGGSTKCDGSCGCKAHEHRR